MKKEIINFILALIIGIVIVLFNLSIFLNWDLFSDEKDNVEFAIKDNHSESDNDEIMNESSIEEMDQSDDEEESIPIDEEDLSEETPAETETIEESEDTIDEEMDLMNEYVVLLDETEIIEEEQSETDETELGKEPTISNIENKWNSLLSSLDMDIDYEETIAEIKDFKPCMVNKLEKTDILKLAQMINEPALMINKILISPDKKIMAVSINEDMVKIIDCETDSVFRYKINYPFILDDLRSGRKIILLFKKIKTFPEILIISHLNRSFNLNFISRKMIRFMIHISDYGKIINIEPLGSFTSNE